MRKESTVRLDTHFLLQRIEARGLKQQWIAERIGVDKKTVGRWCTGKVKRLSRENAEALAALLACELAELTVSDEADVLATKEEQRVAARLLQEQDLLQLLSPSDNWALAESLIKASLQPDLPRRDLGRLYNLLSIAAWRQGHYAEGARHAARAREIGQALGDRGVMWGATYNQAVIDSLLGDVGAALAGYERCLLRPECFDSPREHGKVLSNVGDAYRSLCCWEESVAAQEAALRLFEGLGLDLNLAIGWVSLGLVECERGRLAEAARAYAQGERHARAAGYARGVDCAPIYQADPQSLAGETGPARARVLAALPALARHEVYDLGCQIAARVLRRAGDLRGAGAQLAEGLRRAASFPELSAMLRLEEARLALARGDPAGERAAREAAHEAFRRAGLAVRVNPEPVREHGTGAAIAPQAQPDRPGRGG